MSLLLRRLGGGTGPQTLVAAACVLALSAPAATRVASVTVVAGGNTITLSAPAATPAATATVAAGNQALAITAPAATLVEGAAGSNLAAGGQVVTLTAPAAAALATVTVTAGDQALAITAPAAAAVPGAVIVAAGALDLEISAPIATIAGASSPPGAGGPIRTSRWGYTRADRDRMRLEEEIRTRWDEDDDETTWL